MFSDIEFIKDIFIRYILSLCLLAIMTLITVTGCRADESLPRRTWNVNGTTREALVYVPATAKTNPTPIVFAFHGHGGNMERVARLWDYQKLWPQAIVVYMQGLKTPGKLTDPEGNKTGWQKTIGDQNDRDLKFFDAVLVSLENEYRVDKNRIYATGHSNGGSFTYLLWQARPNVFAAFAPSAAVKGPLVLDNPGFVPKPAFIIAGQQDPLVKFAWQQMMIDKLIQLNQCGAGKPWEVNKRLTIYPSSANAPVVTYIHPGGHIVPEDAPALIVQFFQRTSKS
jgi:polyhydroxybutyrate depolymerase